MLKKHLTHNKSTKPYTTKKTLSQASFFGWIVGLEPTIEHHHCAISQPIVTEFVIFIFFTLSLYVMVGLVSDSCEGDITKLYNTHIQKPITKHLKTRGELLLS